MVEAGGQQGQMLFPCGEQLRELQPEVGNKARRESAQQEAVALKEHAHDPGLARFLLI